MCNLSSSALYTRTEYEGKGPHHLPSIPPPSTVRSPADASLEFENVEDSSGKVTNEEHGRDADEDGEETPLGAVGHLEAEMRTRGEKPMNVDKVSAAGVEEKCMYGPNHG